MNDGKTESQQAPKNAWDMLPSWTVKLEDPRYDIYYPEADSYHDETGGYRYYTYNGAAVESFSGGKNPVRYEIIYHDDSHKRIDCVRLTMADKVKLGNIFNSLPYGIVKKCVPGIGATTLALDQQRDTILVMPTKKLAYQKYLYGRDKCPYHHKFLYVGSDIPEANCKSPTDEEIRNFITTKRESHSFYLKIIVVADSLRRVMEQIQYIKDAPQRAWEKIVKQAEQQQKNPWELLLKNPMAVSEQPMDWHIMVDEIDTFQSDGKFREAMENVIDYYLSFPANKRCLVSATIRPFTHPQLREEPLLEINYEHTEKRTVSIVRANNIYREVVDMLCHYRKSNPDDKVVVAYNSIRSINVILDLLPAEVKADCSVACSSLNQAMVGEFYRSLHSGLLTTPITLMTSAYFVGVDIEERFHLISVADPRQTQALLSPEKLYQISGRCRHPQGLLSETIVFNLYRSKTPAEVIPLEKYEEKAQILSQFANSSEAVQETCKDVLPANFLDVKDSIVARSRHSIFGSQPISIIRLDINGKVVPAYLNIDALGEYQQLCTDIYTSCDRFLQALDATCIIRHFKEPGPDEKPADKLQLRAEQQEDKSRSIVILQQIQSKIDELLMANRQEPINDTTLNRMIRNTYDSKYGRQFLERVKEFYHYVPLEKLVRLLTPELKKGKVCWNVTWYRNMRRSILFACLVKEHPFRMLLSDHFPEGTRITSDEILEKMNAILINIQARKMKDSRSAIQLYHCFFEEKRSHDKVNYRTVGGIKNMGFEPLQQIDAATTVNRILELM